MNHEQRTNNAFTLIELVVAVALLAMTLGFAGVIFKVSIESHRTAGANAEVMRKLRAITDQLNADFKGLQKDGYLILHSELSRDRQEYRDSISPGDFRTDRLYYFSIGDFQSWFPPYVRSNIARIYFGHDWFSLYDLNVPVSKWNLARDVELITPGLVTIVDCNGFSYAWFKADVFGTRNDANDLLTNSVPIDTGSPADVRRLMCQNAGEIKIEWTDGTIDVNNSLVWFGFSKPYGGSYEVIDSAVPPTYYTASWSPIVPKQYWPTALKFTFTLYDSKAILEQGRTFTHIVYLND